MDHFTRIIKRSANLGEFNDCAVIATAVATGEDYDRVYKSYLKQGRTYGSCVSFDMITGSLRGMGYTLKGVQGKYTSKTLLTLERELPKKGTFMILSKGHITAAKDGFMADNRAGSLTRVIAVFKVEKEKHS